MENISYIGNAFSIQMLGGRKMTDVRFEVVDGFPSDAISVVGHADTARVLGVKYNRVNVTLTEGVTLYVAQLVGGRLPEGATELPQGFKFKFYKVLIVK